MLVDPGKSVPAVRGRKCCHEQGRTDRELERNGGVEDWQLRQADQALRMYFVNFLKRTEWHRRPASTVVDEQGRTSPLAALE